ncbi:MAG: exosortase B [Burkholderiales bacterium PBB6]|nr:MAG: exosortase B [Burkholderiales bacterium PBB6]
MLSATTFEKAKSHLPLAAVITATLGILFVPTLWDLFHGAWSTDSQGHGPVVLAISLWLLLTRWPTEAASAVAERGAVAAGWCVLILGCAIYVFGRTLGVLTMEVGAAVPVLAGVILIFRGTNTLKAVWFALFFMAFMVPLPGAMVDALTHPMKIAVSWVAEYILNILHYPIARSGVILQIGQYQMLVADACAGLHTLFTLEAMGLLYLNVVKSTSLARNVALAILIVPIGFTANVIRVIVLTLVTYHFGDAAGQGFLHGFAGMVLFLTALVLIVSVDNLLHLFFSRNRAVPHA